MADTLRDDGLTGLDALRQDLRDELLDLSRCSGYGDETPDGLAPDEEDARAARMMRDLADAYTTLGGDLELNLVDPRDVTDVDELRAAVGRVMAELPPSLEDFPPKLERLGKALDDLDRVTRGEAVPPPVAP